MIGAADEQIGTTILQIDPNPLTLGPPGVNSSLSAQVSLTAPFTNATPSNVLITIKYRKNGVVTTQLSNYAMTAGAATPPKFPYSVAIVPFNVVSAAIYWYEVTCQWNIPFNEKATSAPVST
ncbi:MAG: hypothetical protein RLZZ458_2222 [Planctomycetota bacterium]|jgi:hypothetical protein